MLKVFWAILSLAFSFDNQDLSALQSNQRPSLIYTWSPYMPLSTLGLKEAIDVSQDLGIDIYLLSDPYLRIDPAFAPIKLDPIQSSDLIARGALDHYPAYIRITKSGHILPLHLGYLEKAFLREKLTEDFYVLD